jgi:tRNA dimethylallyltransferase
VPSVHRPATTPLPHVLIVAGPTASGKSALALDLAERLNGVTGLDPVIINTDSMQVYRELRVLTARPTPDEEARIPHRLYGIRPAAEPGSAAWWRAEALTAIEEAHAADRLPILTGGTGLYFLALTEGLAAIPAATPQARSEARGLLAELGAPALHARLTQHDPATAAALNPNDGQRIARAWEVWRSTGAGLAAWQARRGKAAPYRFTAVLLDPPREQLRAAIAARFQAMLAQGALEEVRALLDLHLDPALPAMRAHGVPEVSAYLRGEISLEQAGRRTELVTGQYTKRQATWFRHHALAPPGRSRTIPSRYRDSTQLSEHQLDEIIAFIHAPG